MALQTAQTKEMGRAPLPLTSREDNWWFQPLITVIVLGSFVIYSLIRGLQNQYFEWGPYLSPLYSPLLPFNLNLFGWPVSPSIYIVAFPLAFRLTCYYYRRAYYRAFFWDPPACAVREVASRKHYEGERRFPYILQNIHRFAFYIAVVFIFILGWDAVRAFFFDVNGHTEFHVAVGSLVFTLNVVLLAAYTFSCHSFRHLIGGRVDCFSCTLRTQLRHTLWQRVTALNARHSLLAWASLIMVSLTDVYVLLVASGTIQDFRFF